MQKSKLDRCSTLPNWITLDLIAETRAFWQPYYQIQLTENDVIELLLNIGNLFRLLREPIRKE